MKKFTQKDIKTLFLHLCCSRCKNEFTINSIKILEQDCDMMLCSLSCEKCGKDFGEVVFNYNRKSDKHNPLEILDDYDEVLDRKQKSVEREIAESSKYIIDIAA